MKTGRGGTSQGERRGRRHAGLRLLRKEGGEEKRGYLAIATGLNMYFFNALYYESYINFYDAQIPGECI